MEGAVAETAVEVCWAEMAAGVGSEVASEATVAVGTPLLLGTHRSHELDKFPDCTTTRICVPSLS